MKRCISCGRLTDDHAEFPCPNCDEIIVRCRECRARVTHYKSKCGWEGP